MRTALSMTCAGAAIAAAAAVADVAAATAPGAAVFLPHTGSECSGVPQCLAVGGAPVLVTADRIATLAIGCPASHPHVWHWDTEQHAHVLTRLVGRTRSTLTFAVGNQGDRIGEVRILVGCSTERFDAAVSGTQTSRRGARPRTPAAGTGSSP